MKGLMEEAIRRLQEEEGRDPPFSENARIFDLMEEVAAQPTGLEQLVRQFGGSASAAVAGTLAVLVARRADSPSRGTQSVTIPFIRRLKCRDQPEVLQSALASIDLDLLHGRMGGRPPLARKVLSFVLVCLDDSTLFVRDGAVGVLMRMRERRVLRQATSNTMRRKLRQRLAILAADDTERSGDAKHLLGTLSR